MAVVADLLARPNPEGGIDQAEVFESEPIPEETEENQKEMEDETEAGESGVDQS